MKSKLLHDQGQKTFVVIMDTGDEAAGALLAFARNERLAASRFTAIGAFNEATLGFFDWQTKKYKSIPVFEQVEVLSLIGDITLSDGGNGEPKVHAHVVLGRPDGTSLGGHLLRATVRPTLEVIVVESPGYLRRRHDPETGLALIRL